jgi:4-amino-4-deoxy-L-arabinose transferase-like glycosyltransferase
MHSGEATVGTLAWQPLPLSLWAEKAAARALAAVVCIAALVRLAFAALPRVVRWDEAGYQLIARSLLAGQGYCELLGARDLQQPPMVAYLSALGRLLHLPPAWATAAPVFVLLGSLLPLPVYGLARGLTGSRRVALIAAVLAAIHPALAVSPLYWGTMTEPPYVLFILCALYAAWRLAASGGWRWAIGLGVSCGLAYLTRPEAMLYLAVGIGFALLYRWRPRPADLVHAGLAVLAFLLCAMPYLVYVYRVTGRWTFSGKQGISMDIAWAFVNRDPVAHDRVVSSLDATGQEIMWLSAAQYDKSLLGWIREDPARFAWQVRTNARDTWHALLHADLLSPWLALLALFGVAGQSWTRARLRREGLLIVALLPLLSLWAFFVLSRFLAVAVPIILIWAALGVEHLVRWLAETRARLLAGRSGSPGVARPRAALSFVYALPLALASAALLAGGAHVAGYEIIRMPFDRISIAAWLASEVPPGAGVMLRNSETALYAHLPAIALPDAAWSQILDYARARKVHYIVVEDTDIAEFRPQLSGLLDTAHLLSGVRFVAEHAAGRRLILLYEIEFAT